MSQGSQVVLAIVHGRASQATAEAGAQGHNRLVRQCGRIANEMRLVQHDTVPWILHEKLSLGVGQPQRLGVRLPYGRVGGDDKAHVVARDGLFCARFLVKNHHLFFVQTRGSELFGAPLADNGTLWTHDQRRRRPPE
jgi:hypothetical protein